MVVTREECPGTLEGLLTILGCDGEKGHRGEHHHFATDTSWPDAVQQKKRQREAATYQARSEAFGAAPSLHSDTCQKVCGGTLHGIGPTWCDRCRLKTE